jgi:hypothetical protein
VNTREYLIEGPTEESVARLSKAKRKAMRHDFEEMLADFDRTVEALPLAARIQGADELQKTRSRIICHLAVVDALDRMGAP